MSPGSLAASELQIFDEIATRSVTAIRKARPVKRMGRVAQVVGLTIEAVGPAAEIGEVCLVSPRDKGEKLAAEVVGFRNGRVILMPLGDMTGIGPGSYAEATGRDLRVAVGQGVLGRVINGLGQPIDGGGPIPMEGLRPLNASAPLPLTRMRIDERLGVGVKAIDGLLTVGRGQRIGIFAGSGVGKSTLMGMLARGTEADVNVIALIGERGREVRDFIEKELGDALQRSVLVVATSDQPALLRLKAALLATSLAEYFRDRGQHVLLLMDSLTRLAMAQREVGLAAGEPPATRGYPPSVFGLFPRLLERAGLTEHGSITGFYTVLVDGDDMNEPIADTARGILDGHIILSRHLAEKGQFPAIDVLQSVSRLMDDLVSPDHRRAAREFRKNLAIYRETEDLINIGAYRKGANPEVDRACALIGDMRRFLEQDSRECSDFDRARGELLAILGPKGVGADAAV